MASPFSFVLFCSRGWDSLGGAHTVAALALCFVERLIRMVQQPSGDSHR